MVYSFLFALFIAFCRAGQRFSNNLFKLFLIILETYVIYIDDSEGCRRFSKCFFSIILETYVIYIDDFEGCRLFSNNFFKLFLIILETCVIYIDDFEGRR